MNPAPTQMPRAYSYANRSPSYYRKMSNDFVTLVMTNVFSTVWAMHAHDKAHPSELKEKAEMSRVILGKVMPNDLQDWFASPSHSDAKHHGTCRCFDCLSKKKEAQVSQEERYLIEQGMAPDSQEANAAMDKLLGKRTRPHRGTARSPLINQPHTPTITPNVPETPFTLPTETEYNESPECASVSYSYQYSSGQETITEDEAGRDEPVPTAEFLNIYKEGMHVESTTVTPDFESNASKRARIAPTALNFDK